MYHIREIGLNYVGNRAYLVGGLTEVSIDLHRMYCASCYDRCHCPLCGPCVHMQACLDAGIGPEVPECATDAH